jgi:uncharacterized protein involved in response to NO
MKNESYLFSQVHQPFFIASFFWAILSMIFFLLSYKGIIALPQSPIEFHYYTLSYGVILQAFIGFIFTTYPRFCQTEVIDKKHYTLVFILFELGLLTYFTGSLLSKNSIMISGVMINFIAIALVAKTLYKIFKQANPVMNYDPYWILTGFISGFIAHFIFFINLFLTHPLLEQLAINSTIYLFLLFVTFAVAQRMVHFFSHSIIEKRKDFAKYVFIALIIITLLHTFVIFNNSFLLLTSLIEIALGVYLFLEFKRWELPFKGSPSILQILHVALFWFPIGLLFNALADLNTFFTANTSAALGVHLLVLGFVITMLIGFGTRVTLGHSGQPPHADMLTMQIFYLTQIVVFIRFVYSLNIGFELGLDFLFDISATLWILMFLFWVTRFGMVLISGKKLKINSRR